LFKRRLFDRARGLFLERSTEGVAGFALIEALVALAVVAVCLSAIGTLMATNIRTVVKVDRRVELVSALRKIESALPDRNQLSEDGLAGQMYGNAWSVGVAPYTGPLPEPRRKRNASQKPDSLDKMDSSDKSSTEQKLGASGQPDATDDQEPAWIPKSVVVSARSPEGTLVQVETIRLVPKVDQ
jgi:general secretion pathway protein I